MSRRLHTGRSLCQVRGTVLTALQPQGESDVRASQWHPSSVRGHRGCDIVPQFLTRKFTYCVWVFCSLFSVGFQNSHLQIKSLIQRPQVRSSAVLPILQCLLGLTHDWIFGLESGISSQNYAQMKHGVHPSCGCTAYGIPEKYLLFLFTTNSTVAYSLRWLRSSDAGCDLWVGSVAGRKKSNPFRGIVAFAFSRGIFLHHKLQKSVFSLRGIVILKVRSRKCVSISADIAPQRGQKTFCLYLICF